jgi:hypothetical protein
LIFVQSKERANELYKELAFDDVRADVIHAGLTEQQVLLCVLLLLIHRCLLFVLIVFFRTIHRYLTFGLTQTLLRANSCYRNLHVEDNCSLSRDSTQ